MNLTLEVWRKKKVVTRERGRQGRAKSKKIDGGERNMIKGARRGARGVRGKRSEMRNIKKKKIKIVQSGKDRDLVWECPISNRG